MGERLPGIPVPDPTTRRRPEATPPSLPRALGVCPSPAPRPSEATSTRVRLGARAGAVWRVSADPVTGLETGPRAALVDRK